MTTHEVGWVGRTRESDEVLALREHLGAHNGIVGLESLTPDQVDLATRLFRRDGFVVVRDALDPEQLDFLRSGCERVNQPSETDTTPSRMRTTAAAPLITAFFMVKAPKKAMVGTVDATGTSAVPSWTTPRRVSSVSLAAFRSYATERSERPRCSPISR